MKRAYVKYTGLTPGADSNTYNLFSTVTAHSAKYFFAAARISKILVDIKHSHGFTLKWYKSADRGTTWHQLGENVVPVPSATESNIREILVEPYPDFKLDLVNGGTAQSPFVVDIILVSERMAAA
jgi:hypothetical protein